MNISAQDVITLNNGDEIEVLVQKIGEVEVTYKKWDFQDGPTFTVRKSEIFRIKYQNGTKEVFDSSDEVNVKEKTPKEIEEQIFAEQKARILAEQRIKMFADSIANAQRFIAAQKAKEEKRVADSITNAKRLIAEQKAIEEKRIKKEAIKKRSGHYLSLGSGILSVGYYGILGVGYEYRYRRLGANVSCGWDLLESKISDAHKAYPIVNAGIKLYMGNRKNKGGNLYFNILPFCFRGGVKGFANSSNGSITIFDYPPLYGYGVLLGYSPIWRVSEKVSLGFNIDVGIKMYFNDYPTVNNNIGIIIKFDNKKQ